MGGEFSANGTLASAWVAANITGKSKFKMFTSGIDTPLDFVAGRNYIEMRCATYSLVKSIKRKDNLVEFFGISFKLINRENESQNLLLEEASILDELLMTNPAAGLLYQGKKDQQILPVVKVKETDTLRWEVACGSGSIAYYLLTDSGEVVQPSNQIINISNYQDIISTNVPVKEVKYVNKK